MSQFDSLFQPLHIGKDTLKDRIAMAASTVVLSTIIWSARNGVGLIICSVFKVENTKQNIVVYNQLKNGDFPSFWKKVNWFFICFC
jgi:2,4-dienoyl-CoA reductase-like NADH-dependent reductase (Old Yellow Enzyme family)